MTGQRLNRTRNEEPIIASRMCWACYSWDERKLLEAVLMPFKAAWLHLRGMDVEIKKKGEGTGISKGADMKLLVPKPSQVVEVFWKAR